MNARAHRLLAAAEARYARGDLRPRSDEYATLAGATRWMGRALAVPVSDETARRGAALLAEKYLVAGAAGVAAFALARRRSLLASPLAFALSFYAVEAQGVFVIPALLEGVDDPQTRSRALVAEAGGTLSVMATVIPIAAHMLTGPLIGRGAVEAWCVGCLAVVLWYNELAHG